MRWLGALGADMATSWGGATLLGRMEITVITVMTAASLAVGGALSWGAVALAVGLLR